MHSQERKHAALVRDIKRQAASEKRRADRLEERVQALQRNPSPSEKSLQEPRVENYILSGSFEDVRAHEIIDWRKGDG